MSLRPRALLALSLLLPLTFGGAVWGQVHATIGTNPDRLQGTGADGDLLLNTPEPVSSGSSVSHWDPSTFPNLLMEPAINPDLPFLGLDVTPGQMQDIGWQLGESQFAIFSLDPPGIGIDDQRPFAGAPGNSADTLGRARENLLNGILSTWGETLQSPVQVDVLVTFLPLPCLEGVGAVLAAAGTTFIFRDDSGALPFPNVWYHAALTEAIAGIDLTGPPEEGGGDIIVLMNDDIDNECLGPGTGYYYGLDGNAPPNQIAATEVVLHELGHGLGFANFTNENTGELNGGLPGIYDLFTHDQTTGKTWDQMTDEERRTSAVNFRKVSWNGEMANQMAANILAPGVPELVISDPPSVAGTYPVGTASFGPPPPEGGLQGQIVEMLDGTDLANGDASVLNGCLPATNPDELSGKIALINRGACAFTMKVANAQAAGAIAAVIVNNAGNNAIGLGGDDPGITIPVVSVGRTDGNRIRQALGTNRAGFTADNRFLVEVQFEDGDLAGTARTMPLTEKSTWSYFFDMENPEITVKVLNGCGINGHQWVFIGGMTDVEVLVTITDTVFGSTVGYLNPKDVLFSTVRDLEAFANCP